MSPAVSICRDRMGIFSEPEPKVLTPEEDEEQLIMRRLRNSCDELKRGYRWLDYRWEGGGQAGEPDPCFRMQRVVTKADDSKHQREGIELFEEKVT